MCVAHRGGNSQVALGGSHALLAAAHDRLLSACAMRACSLIVFRSGIALSLRIQVSCHASGVAAGWSQTVLLKLDMWPAPQDALLAETALTVSGATPTSLQPKDLWLLL